jgi:hypothetical protein
MKCQTTKVFYHSEFSAERAATIRGIEWGVEMMHYACGTHWHIANKEPDKRGRHIKEFKSYCDICHTAMNPSRWMKHKILKGHIAKEKGLG